MDFTTILNYIHQGRTAITDLIKESRDIVRKAVDDASEKMKNNDNQKVKDEIASSIKEHSTKFNAVLEDFMKKTNEQIKNNPSVSNAYASIQNKIKETTSALNKSRESGSGDFKKFTDEFKTSWTNITKEMAEGLDFKKIKEEELEPFYQNAVNKIKSIAKELEKAIDDITSKNK